MIRDIRTGSLIALALVILASVPAPGLARQGGDAWAGTYEYTYLVPTLSGVTAPITYTLTVRAGTGEGGATIKGLGLQTNDEVVCDTRGDASRLVVSFRSYPDGGTTNQFGVQLYKPGDVLLTLERRGKGAQQKLITLWGKYNTDAPKPKGGGVQFKPSN